MPCERVGAVVAGEDDGDGDGIGAVLTLSAIGLRSSREGIGAVLTRSAIGLRSSRGRTDPVHAPVGRRQLEHRGNVADLHAARLIAARMSSGSGVGEIRPSRNR